MAEPGEFSERAVLNGRIDLLQAEAIGELIDARTNVQARLALSQLGGALSDRAQGLRATLLDVISRLEAALDFSEDGYDFIQREEAISLLRLCRDRITELLATFDRGRLITTGLTLVIAGQPNAGKSTLLNYLCGSERAIVTDIPGTTRDLLRETIEIGGLPVTIVDTAGLRDTADVVESAGIARARAAAAQADLVVYLVDSSRGFTDADRAELAALPAAQVVFTKTDLAPPPAGEIGVSIVRGESTGDLLQILDERVRERWAGDDSSALVVNERQRAELIEAGSALEAAELSLGNRASEEVVLVDLYRASSHLSALVGAISNDDVMREIFGRFCIGK